MRTQGGSKLDEEIGGSLSEERTQGSCTCLGASMWIAGDLVFIDKVILPLPTYPFCLYTLSPTSTV